MLERAWLLCDVPERNQSHVDVTSEMFDGTEFRLTVRRHLVRFLEADEQNPKRGYLEIQYSGEEDRRATITLPVPILDMGHKITVSTDRIMRNLDDLD